MNFTQEQISDLLLDVANSENGSNLLMQLSLNAFMKSERHLHQRENEGDYCNGYRERKARGFGKEMILKVPRTRNGTFYPVLLNVLRNEDEERRKLIFSLYRRGLTTEQVSDVYEEIYGKEYSKQQISYLMKDSREEVDIWLKRKLESHYLVLYIDATFVHTRRDKSVSKEGYYTILEIKEDGSREVLSIVNHPTEGPPSIQRMIYTTNWIERLNRDYKRVLKMRGAMPSPESILFLMGSVAMEKEYKSYSYPVTAFREIEELKKKQIIEVAV